MGKRITAILTMLALLGALLCGAALAEEDPVCVRVGDYSYPLSLVQGSLDSSIKVSDAASDVPLTDEERAELASDIVNNIVNIGVIESRLAEDGQHDFTDAEVELLKAAASSQYEAMWQSVYQKSVETDPDVTAQQVTQAMDEEGYDMDAFYREIEVSERQRRAIALYVPPITLTRQQVDDYYETYFLAPDRERYANDIATYEQEVLAGDNESFYTPEGYRSVRQILLAYPDGVDEAVKPEKAGAERAAKVAGDALVKLTQVVTTTDDWSDLDAPRAEYDAAVAALEEANKVYADRLREETLPRLQTTLDEIRERLDAGIAFGDLIPKYSQDKSERNLSGTGYPVHPQSQGWPKDFIDAAMALEKPGDVSEPVLTDKGVHILYFVGDIPAGDHVLTDEERQSLEETTLYYYQTQALLELIEEWKQNYDIETHPELLKY